MSPSTTATMDRRTLLKLVAAAPMAAAFTWTGEEVLAASAQVRTAAVPFTPVFFTAHEYDIVQVLVDLVIPKDAHSGSATEAGVPQFMDFILNEETNRQNAMRGGLSWLELECHRRFSLDFVACAEGQRQALLDDIAWPRREAKPGMAPGVAFFNSFRDLTASGFWSSKMGIDDLQYLGNTVVPEWTGCPDEVLRKLGLL
jgi:gluconate 2-dehydrogenase gamma chain